MARFVPIGESLIVPIDNIAAVEKTSYGVRILYKEAAYSHGATGGSIPAATTVTGVDFLGVLAILRANS